MRILNSLKRRLSNLAYATIGRDALSKQAFVARNDLERIGSGYGGWSIPVSKISEDSICYCVGCGEDISFDLGLIKKFGCKVYGYDPTPRAIAHVKDIASDNENYVFSPFGIWKESGTLKFYAPQDPNHVSHSITNLQKTDKFIEVEVRSLKEVAISFGHQKIDLLKLDIEGAEYEVIQSFLKNEMLATILCVEYDEVFSPLDDGYKQRIRDSINQLNSAGYQMVHSEGNGNYTFLLQD